MGPTPQTGKLNKLFSDRNLTCLSIAIIVIGIALRVAVYFQNRCLIIDEANVARNIYERGFAALTRPLSYEQYAPPLFLWIIKCFSLSFGFSEFSLRFFSLLCGLASLWLIYKALKQYAGNSALWYSLMIFASGIIYVRYSSELKQYMCDTVVVLSLLLLALRVNIFTTPRLNFVLIWCLAGSVAIWLSMPSVFMLAGVGGYYFYQIVRERKYNLMGLIVPIAIVWLLQFAAYYFLILKPQIQSDYLQSVHKYSFLFKFPSSKYKFDNNVNVLDTVLSAMGGKWALSIVFHIITLFTGGIWLLRKHTAKALLVIIPICALYVAAATHQYALVPRIILFIMPLLLILIAAGLQVLLQTKYLALKAVWILAALICIFNFSSLYLLVKPMELEEVTKSMAFIKQHKITGEHLYVHNACAPAYTYYTTIHPKKAEWADLANAHLLQWNSNYDSLGRTFSEPSALLYGWWPVEEIAIQRAAIRNSRKETQQFIMPQTSAFIYE